MLSTRKAFRYELTATVAGVLLSVVFHYFFVPKTSIFSWLLWVHAVICVTLGFVDHVCVGWRRLSLAVQGRRLIINFVLCVPLAKLYYWSIFQLSPDQVSLAKVVDTVTSYQKLYNIYYYWAPLIYWGLYVASSIVIVSCYRFFTNLGVVIFHVLNETFLIV